jgi:uncharacterized protein YqjF (DUF2071 family)
LSAPARQASVLREFDHRPWPLPRGTWMQAQTWDDLAFLHWRIPVEAVRERIPEALAIDVYEGGAWIGITPFQVSALRVRGMLPFPRVSTFLETNVRTYVTVEDKPGIWFFSLDAASQLMVEAARRLYKLPYFRARMSWDHAGGRIDYSTARNDARGHRAVFRGWYGPSGDVFNAERGSVEHFLTERYCLYTWERGRLYRAEIHHPPWPLQGADAEVDENTMPPPGLELPNEEPLVHFSARQDVVIWPLEEVQLAAARSDSASRM